jgi:hypothetical protein
MFIPYFSYQEAKNYISYDCLAFPYSGIYIQIPIGKFEWWLIERRIERFT